MNDKTEPLKGSFVFVFFFFLGIAYCQLLDACINNKVPLHKLNWNATFEDENMHNLKILSAYLKKFNIPKNISIEKLAKGKFQSNNEFLSWWHDYINTRSLSYTAIVRRLQAIEKQKRCKEYKSSYPCAYV
jgi:hypothetical protein